MCDRYWFKYFKITSVVFLLILRPLQIIRESCLYAIYRVDSAYSGCLDSPVGLDLFSAINSYVHLCLTM